MNNLPKNDQNSPDFSAFAGKYPEEPLGVDKTKKPVIKSPLPPVPPPAPPAPAPGNFAKPETSVPAAPIFQSSPLAPEGPKPTIPVTPTTTVVSEGDKTLSKPVLGTASSAVSTAETENPFVVPAPPDTKSTGAGKRLLLFLILIVALIGGGFLAFKMIGPIITSRQPVVLTYWGLWENEQIIQPVIEEYRQSHPNVEIAYSKQTPKNYRERLQAEIGRGEGPDIFRFHNTWVPMLKDELVPAGKTGYTTAEFQQTFYPIAASDLLVDDKVLGVPLMIDGLGLYYNEDLLRAAGVTPPTTWEDFRRAALTLTVKDEDGQIFTAGTALGTTNNVEHFSDILGLMMLQNGVDLKNPVRQEAYDVLSFYRLFAEEPNQVWDETMDNSIMAFANGQVAMIFAPSWQVFTIKQTNPNLHFQITPVPQLAGTNTTWASYWVEGVSTKSKHIDQAWEFVKFISQKDSLITLYTEASNDRGFGEPYSRVDLAQTVIDDPYVGAYIKQAQTAQAFFLASRTYDNGINDRMIKYLEDAVNSTAQGVSPQAAMETAAVGFAQVLNNFGYTPATAP